MRTVLALMLCLWMPMGHAAEWLTYCTTDKAVKVREEASKKWYTKVEHHGGSFVSVTTKKRLKHVQFTCTSTIEPVCTAQGGENPVVQDKPNGQWKYELGGHAHQGGVFCAYFWVQP